MTISTTVEAIAAIMAGAAAGSAGVWAYLTSRETLTSAERIKRIEIDAASGAAADSRRHDDEREERRDVIRLLESLLSESRAAISTLTNDYKTALDHRTECERRLEVAMTTIADLQIQLNELRSWMESGNKPPEAASLRLVVDND